MDSTFMVFVCLIGLFILGFMIFAIIRNHRRISVSSSNNRTNISSLPRNSTTQTNSSSTNRTVPTRTTSSDPLTETEIMDYFANTRHNQKDNWFRFRYKRVNNEWRAYIIRMPSLNGRSPDCHMTHRYSDSNGNYWVCRNPQPTNLKDCQAISKEWADRLLEYVAPGVEANSQRW